jgi:hypothetical protein
MRLRIRFFLFLATASHGILDAFTDGGRGIAFFAPFGTERYFFPHHPDAGLPHRARIPVGTRVAYPGQRSAVRMDSLTYHRGNRSRPPIRSEQADQLNRATRSRTRGLCQHHLRLDRPTASPAPAAASADTIP